MLVIDNVRTTAVKVTVAIYAAQPTPWLIVLPFESCGQLVNSLSV